MRHMKTFLSDAVVGCHCINCDYNTEEELLPDECPWCGGLELSYSYADDHLNDRAEQQIDEEKIEREGD